MARTSNPQIRPGRPRRKMGIVRSILLRLVLWLIAMTVLGGAAGVFWIDYQIRDRFDNQLWEIPVHIYSRPFELYPGLSVSVEHLEKRLLGLGYRRVDSPKQAGEYAVGSSTMAVITRPFVFWDGPQESTPIQISLKGDRIDAIKHRKTDKPLAVVRLRPHLIGNLSDRQHEDRYLMRLDEFPPLLLSGLLAVEDKNFTNHYGVDLKAILRAFVANVLAGKIVQGGSTLTQQLIKNVYGRDDRTYSRKLLEIAMAVVLEYRLSKDEILEAYCNEVFLGQDGKRAVHGFGLGSRYLFGRPVSELNAAEIAQLVGMIKAPSSYHPVRNPQRAAERRKVVLSVMHREGLISDRDFDYYSKTPLDAESFKKSHSRQYASFVDIVVRQLKEKNSQLKLGESDYSVFTTMDIEVQRAAEKALTTQLALFEKQNGLPPGALDGAIVVVRPDDGQILAAAGGRNAFVGGFNRTVDARRPIGSLIKPVIYLTALSDPARWTLSSRITDEPVTYKTTDGKRWSPKNFDDEFVGDITMLNALAQSRNIPAVRVGMKIGVQKVAQNLSKLGVDYKVAVYPSMLLGAVELSPMDVAQVYQSLANYGYKIQLQAISTISENAREIINPANIGASSVVQASAALLSLYGMQEAVRSGTAKRLRQDFEAKLNLAGKTGTTDDFRDSWFVGISGNLLGVVWVGADDNRSTGLTGSSGALRVWSAMMKRLYQQPLTLSADGDFENVKIDLESGLRAISRCKQVRNMPFVRGSAPKEKARCQ